MEAFRGIVIPGDEDRLDIRAGQGIKKIGKESRGFRAWGGDIVNVPRDEDEPDVPFLTFLQNDVEKEEPLVLDEGIAVHSLPKMQVA